MTTDALPYLIESLKIAAQSPLSFVALIIFVIAIGLFIVFRPGQKYSTLTILGAFAMFIGAIVVLALSVTKGFSEPKRVYYVGADTSAGDTANAAVHFGIFRKMGENTWEDVPLKPGDSYYYTFKYESTSDGRFYLMDESRQLRFEVNTEERRIYWQPIGKDERNRLYDIVVLL
jgi:hypothetical protein